MPIPDPAIHTSDAAARAQPIDLGHLRQQTCGDLALQAELLALFADQARAILRDLAALEGGEAAARRATADLCHRLCGSARAIGAWEVADIAEGLERVSRPRPGDPPGARWGEAPGLATSLAVAVGRATLVIEGLRPPRPPAGTAAHDDATRR